MRQAHPDWRVTAYVRSTKPEVKLKAALKAARIVVGDFGDMENIKHLSREHDIAVNAGSSFTVILSKPSLRDRKQSDPAQKAN